MGKHKHQCKRLLTFAVLAITAGVASAATETQSDHLRFDWSRILTDPAEMTGKLAEQREQLESQINQADSPTDKAHAQLTLANWWLATPTARPATRWLIGVETAADRKAMTDAATKAESLIQSARTSLTKSATSRDAKDAKSTATRDADDEKQDRSQIEQAADVLAAFVDVFQLAQRDRAAESTREAWPKAGRGLAATRESDNAELAAAARLWQAFALAQAGKRERALDTLPESLLKPQHPPYDLMSRLLRCKLLAESGQYSAAVALLGRMETILKTWVPSQDRNSTRRLISFVQYRVVSDWIKNLRTSTRPTATAPLEPILTNIDDDFADLKSPNIYYMATAIPPKIAPASGGKKQRAITTAPAASRPA